MFGILQCLEFRNVGRPGMVRILVFGILVSWDTYNVGSVGMLRVLEYLLGIPYSRTSILVRNVLFLSRYNLTRQTVPS